MTEEAMEKTGQEETQDLHPANVRGRGFQNFGPEDAVLPRVRLNGKTGFFEFNLRDEDEARETLTIIPIFMAKSRVYFDPAETSSEVFCRSANGDVSTWIQPGFWKDDTPPKACMACQYGKWASSKQGKRQPPECTLHWNFLAVRPGDLGTPFVFSVRGTSIPAASRMMTVLNRMGKDLFCAEVTLGSDEVGEGMRKYFKMTFDSHRLMDDAEMPLYEEIYESYVGDDPAMITAIMGGSRFAGNVTDESAEEDKQAPFHEPGEDVPF